MICLRQPSKERNTLGPRAPEALRQKFCGFCNIFQAKMQDFWLYLPIVLTPKFDYVKLRSPDWMTFWHTPGKILCLAWRNVPEHLGCFKAFSRESEGFFASFTSCVSKQLVEFETAQTDAPQINFWRACEGENLVCQQNGRIFPPSFAYLLYYEIVD